MDTGLLDRMALRHSTIVTMEENVLQGGFGLAASSYLYRHYPGIRVINISLPDAYVEHGNVSVLRSGLGIDSDSIVEKLLAAEQ